MKNLKLPKVVNDKYGKHQMQNKLKWEIISQKNYSQKSVFFDTFTVTLV